MGEKRQKNGKKDIQTEKEIDPLRDTRKLTDGTPMRDEWLSLSLSLDENWNVLEREKEEKIDTKTLPRSVGVETENKWLTMQNGNKNQNDYQLQNGAEQEQNKKERQNDSWVSDGHGHGARGRAGAIQKAAANRLPDRHGQRVRAEGSFFILVPISCLFLFYDKEHKTKRNRMILIGSKRSIIYFE